MNSIPRVGQARLLHNPLKSIMAWDHLGKASLQDQIFLGGVLPSTVLLPEEEFLTASLMYWSEDLQDDDGEI